jgi:hypothetical protein
VAPPACCVSTVEDSSTASEVKSCDSQSVNGVTNGSNFDNSFALSTMIDLLSLVLAVVGWLHT